MKAQNLLLVITTVVACSFFSCSNILSDVEVQENEVSMKSAIDNPDSYNIFLDGLAYSLSLALEDSETARESLAYKFASSGRNVLPLSQLVKEGNNLTELGAIWHDYLMMYYQISLVEPKSVIRKSGFHFA